MPASKLSAQQARKIAQAEARFADAKRALAEAKQEREDIRARYADRVPVGTIIRAGGLMIRRRVQTTGQSFRLAGFLERHKLTAAMRPFVSPAKTYEVWNVDPAADFGEGSSRRRSKTSPKQPVEA